MSKMYDYGWGCLGVWGSYRYCKEGIDGRVGIDGRYEELFNCVLNLI